MSITPFPKNNLRTSQTSTFQKKRKTSKIIEKYVKFIHCLNRISEVFLVALMFFMTSIIVLQVFRRYIMNSSYMWPEELAGYIMVWIVFIGASIALYKEEHIGLTVFLEKWFKRSKKTIQVTVYLILFISLILLMITSWNVALINKTTTSMSMGISLFWARLALAVGFSLMTLNLIYLVGKLFYVKSGEN